MGIKVIKRIAGLNLDDIARLSLQGKEKLIADISKGQLADGESPSGARLPKYKSKEYVARKPAPKTAPGGRMNLKLTGDFYRGIRPKLAKTAITFPESQQDPKYQYLKKWSDTGTLLTWNKKSQEKAKQAFFQAAVIDTIKKLIYG